MQRSFVDRLCSIAGLSFALAACATAPPENSSPFGPEFGLVSELSPEFASKAEGLFTTIRVYEDGKERPFQNSELIFKCAGRKQEFFDFSERAEGGAPELISRDEPSHRRRFDASTFPKDMLFAFSDRSKASDDDAIKNIIKLEPGAWPPFGLSDYLQFDDGWLVAYDLGEFGGALIWLPKEGDSYIVSPENTHDLLQAGDVVYAAQGLDHLSLRSGGILTVIRTSHRSRLPDAEGNIVERLISNWVAQKGHFPAGSSVQKISLRNGLPVGLTRYGLIVVGEDGVVRYSHPDFYDRRKVVQYANSLFVAEDGRVYVGGADMIGVYSGLPDDLTPRLYARRDCDFIFEEREER